MYSFKGKSTKDLNWIATWKDSQVMANGDTYVSLQMDQSGPTQKDVKKDPSIVDAYPTTVSRTDKNGNKNYTVKMSKSQMDKISAVTKPEKANAYAKNDPADDRNVVTFNADAIIKGNGLVIPNTAKEVKPSTINPKWTPSYSLYRHEANVGIAQDAKAKERQAQAEAPEAETQAEVQAEAEAEAEAEA